LPERTTDRHAAEIANFALEMLNTITEMKFCGGHKTIKIRIGINSGMFCTLYNLIKIRCFRTTPCLG